MKAVILAAGKGTRLGKMTATTPKCLVTVGERTILDYQLDALEAAGLTDIIVVSGYLADQVAGFSRGRYRTITNTDYEKTNSIYSLWLAREEVGASDFVLLNGDVVADPRMVTELVNSPHACATLIDNQKTCVDGEMNVIVQNGCIRAFSKEINASEADGESVQISKFGQREASLLFGRMGQLISAGETQHFPAYAYDIIFSQSRMSPVYVGNHWHHEIDTREDYEKCTAAMKNLGGSYTLPATCST